MILWRFHGIQKCDIGLIHLIHLIKLSIKSEMWISIRYVVDFGFHKNLRMIQVNAIMVWTVVDFQISAENDENCWSMKVERFNLFLFVLWFLFISFYCNNKIHVDFFLHKEFTFYQQSNRVFRNIKIVRSVYAIYSKLAMKTRHCYQLKTFFELFLDVKQSSTLL